ncbi:MAG: hypothetical protein JO271_08140 [Verrucomicrobia bacterium]|nr:hypothetical protein [Verrucomicrobiota bacterium]MBV9273790.1 hypothetical protein [Verrucomicrobiota bacterium]
MAKGSTRVLLSSQPIPSGHRWVGLLLVLGIFWVLTLSVSPELHELVHPDAGHENHDCAVTLFLGGGLIHTAVMPKLIPGSLFTFLFQTPSEPVEVSAPLFTGQRVSERGPPADNG